MKTRGRASLAFFAAFAGSACSGDEPSPSKHVPAHVAGTLDGETLTYDSVTRSEVEILAGGAQPFVRFETDSGIRALVLSAETGGERPYASQPVAFGLLRPGVGEPWYCASKGTVEYPPRASRGPGSTTLSGFSRIAACSPGEHHIAFPRRIPTGRPFDPVASDLDLLAAAVVSDAPSEATWSFSAPSGDFYLSFEGNVADGAGGFLVAIAHEVGATTLRIGLACVSRSATSGETIEATGIGEIQWCPGAPVEDDTSEVRLGSE